MLSRTFYHPPFPIELWEMIFDEVLAEGHGRLTLKLLVQCALVCRAFNEIVRRYLKCAFTCRGATLDQSGREDVESFQVR